MMLSVEAVKRLWTVYIQLLQQVIRSELEVLDCVLLYEPSKRVTTKQKQPHA